MTTFRTIAAGLGLALLPLTAVAETTWIMASGYPEDSFFTENIRLFIDEVEEASDGELRIDLRSNGDLIKLDAIRRAVQAGQIQMGEIRFGVYGNESPMFTLDSLPNVASDYDAAIRLMEAQKPWFDRVFGEDGMKVIAYQPWPGQGFYTDFPVESVDQFDGVKLRIYSEATQRMGDLLGFQATILPFAEVPQAFSTGLIEALFTSAQTGNDIQAWDYVSDFTYTGSMHNKNGIIVNTRALEALPEDLQAEIVAAGERMTERAWEMSKAAGEESTERLRAEGMNVSDAPEALQAALAEIGTQMIEEWRAEASEEERAVLDAYLASGG
ncbi:TRAP transporter substrate-binding protein [Jannaschia rubra]|uniref:C4-dicarboxylate-binding periplasmic protein n=1 Tax=Jannaschia rubra TaxID=282197 RepID=A0A0M6XP59_9RHOB|nr:TRAP transporter substrate-binding protein [Jannaschia rubra]CTQ32678.1 C4-dicarboxylate-binding periplasmic protein precursor [Jannaschia rubra]SFF87284.1 TRAP-type C4-dicarboxylate transport system, substrate-binding protein [Jannaschia rubra]